jgi:FkbM family methyltransferase
MPEWCYTIEVPPEPVPTGWRPFVRNVQTLLPSALRERRLDIQQWSYRARHRPHEPEFLALRELLSPDAVCIDGGANRGQSIDSIRTVMGPDVRITAFEPQRALALRLMCRYGAVPTVRVVRAGIGEEHGEMTLYVPSYRGYAFDALASTDEPSATDWFRYTMWRYDPALVTIESQQVPIVRLDDIAWPDRVHFIKLDVQRMELRALHGAKDLLVRDKPVLMVETPDQPIMSFLAGLGYTAWYFVDDKLTSVRPAWALNVLFLA